MNFDRLKEAFVTLIREVMSGVDYHALYPSKVVQQDANGNLDLQPEDGRIAAPTGVPIRLGIPGAKVTVGSGGRVLLGFENGDPRFPVALLWDTSAVTKLEINATEIVLNGGSQHVARVGDKTIGHSHTAIFALTAPPGGGPVTGTITIQSSTDTINEGASGVKA